MPENIYTYDQNLVSEFVKESGSERLPITEVLEKMETHLDPFIKDDEKFVVEFNGLVGSNKDIALLLGHFLLSDYDELGEKSRERVRESFKEALHSASKENLPNYLKLLSNVSGRILAGNMADTDMKFFDLISVLIESGKDKDSFERDSVIAKIQNDLDGISNRLSEKSRNSQ